MKFLSKSWFVSLSILFTLIIGLISHPAHARDNCTLLDDAFYGAMEKGDEQTVEALMKALDEEGGTIGSASDDQCAKAIAKVSKALSYAKAQDMQLEEQSSATKETRETKTSTPTDQPFHGKWIIYRLHGKGEELGQFDLVQKNDEAKGTGSYKMKQGVCSPPEEFCEWAEAYGNLVSVEFKDRKVIIEVNPTADPSDGHTLTFTLDDNDPDNGTGTYAGLPGSFKTFKIRVTRSSETKPVIAKKPAKPIISPKPTPPKGKAPQNKNKVCNAYVNHVMGVINKFEKRGCIFGGEMFHKNRKAHFDMCTGMSASDRKRIVREEYDNKLARCVAQTSGSGGGQLSMKKDRCETYVNKVMQKITAYEMRGCQFGGELFHKNTSAHYDYCQPMTASEQRDIYAIYDAKLAQCPAELKCANPRDETKPECQALFGQGGNPIDIHDLPGFIAVLPVKPNINLSISIFGSGSNNQTQANNQQLVKACSQYAASATSNQAENLRRRCGYSGELWSANTQKHFEACLNGGRPFVINATNIRAGKLRQCIGALMCITPAQQKTPYCQSLAPKPGTGGFGGVDAKRMAECRRYEQDAVKLGQINQKSNCGFQGEHWHTNNVQHFNSCITAERVTFHRQLRERQAKINQCRVNTNPARQACAQPIEGILKYAAENSQRKCGFTGPLWSTDRETQLKYCEQQVKEKGRWVIDAMGLERVRLLSVCRQQSADGGACRKFGLQAADQYKQSQTNNCNFKGKIWSADAKAHDLRCRKMGIKQRDWEVAIRTRALENCAKKSINKQAFCQTYGKEAANQYSRSKTHKCGFKTGTIWHGDAKRHEARCMKASIQGAKNLSGLREKALAKCRGGFCTVYTSKTMKHVHLNRQENCGFGGALWHSDRNKHFQECKDLTRKNALNLQEQREDALKVCFSKRASRGACAQLKADAEAVWARATAKSKNTAYLMRNYKRYQRVIDAYLAADKAVKAGNEAGCKKLIGSVPEF